MKIIRIKHELILFVFIFSLISCKNEFNKCCEKENMNLIFHEKNLENGQEIDWVQCKGKNNQQIEFKIIDGKIRKKLTKQNDSIYVSSIYDENGEKYLVDTILMKKGQKPFEIGWSWQKDNTPLPHEIEDSP